MAKCKFLKRPHRKVCLGDLNDLIILQTRDITEPLFDTVDFDENFGDLPEVYAKIKTTSGRTVFDGVDTDVNVSHEITIRFDPVVTSETWVEFEGRRLDILRVEDLEERHEWQLLLCLDRGVGEASKA